MGTQKTSYTVKTKKKGLNLREKPSKESKVLRLIPNGEKVKVVLSAETPEGWIAIEGGGFVMKEYLD